MIVRERHTCLDALRSAEAQGFEANSINVLICSCRCGGIRSRQMNVFFSYETCDAPPATIAMFPRGNMIPNFNGIGSSLASANPWRSVLILSTISLLCILMKLHTSLYDYFSDRLRGVSFVEQHTRDYVINLLGSNHHERSVSILFDAKRSVVIEWAKTRNVNDFATVQGFADSLYFKNVMFGPDIENQALLETIGAESYAHCDRLLRGNWPLYRELHARYSEICRDVRAALK